MNLYTNTKLKIATCLFPNKYVLTRTACLGNDIFNLHNSKYDSSLRQVNIQKGRVDLLLDFLQNKPSPKAHIIQPYLERKDLFAIIMEQQKVLWKKVINSNEIVIMDSFSELTDQLFAHKKEGWQFCAHYSDLKHSKEFSENFYCLGLLEESLFKDYYKAFFDYVCKNNHKKIVFIHFPASLDSRPLFKERAEAIFKAIQALKNDFEFLYDIRLEPKEILPYEGDSFPYHFSDTTKKAFLNKWPMEVLL